jgi:hypothetical protein
MALDRHYGGYSQPTATAVAFCWLLNDGIALSRNRDCAALDQFAIFKRDLRHVSRSLDTSS